jgi:hypothetical protein
LYGCAIGLISDRGYRWVVRILSAFTILLIQVFVVGQRGSFLLAPAITIVLTVIAESLVTSKIVPSKA